MRIAFVKEEKKTLGRNSALNSLELLLEERLHNELHRFKRFILFSKRKI